MPGKLQQKAVNRQRVEPVANLADDLRQPQTAKIQVLAQQPHVRGKRDRTGFVFSLWFHGKAVSEICGPLKITDSVGAGSGWEVARQVGAYMRKSFHAETL